MTTVVRDFTALLGNSWTQVLERPATTGPIILTYSFPSTSPSYMTAQFGQLAAASYRPFGDAEKAAARAALSQWATVSGVTFIEVSHAERADVRFGFFDFNTVPEFASFGGVGYWPYAPFYASGTDVLPQSEEYWQAQGVHFDRGGDTFYNANYRAGWQTTSQDWFTTTLLHEIGHALGLKHPHEGGGASDAVLATDLDRASNTVMSYVKDVVATSLGPLDKEAVSYLYGVASADGTQYVSWSYDAATETVYETAGTANDLIRGTGTHDVINGGAGNDVIYASSGDDVITGGAGRDNISGGIGLDTYITGLSALQTAQLDYGGLNWSSLQTADGTEWIIDVERFVFGDTVVAFDIEGDAGQAYRLYQAAFDRQPDKGGLGFWISALDKGQGDLNWVAANFILSAEFKQTYGEPATVSNDQFLTLLYANVLDRKPDQGGLTYWTSELNQGRSREWVLVQFSESAENKANVIGVIHNGIEYEIWMA